MSLMATSSGRITVSLSRNGQRAVTALTQTTYWLSGALAVVATVAGVATFFVPNLLGGPAVMNGSARGTALVIFAIAVPTLIIAMLATSRGSLRALIIWLGAAAYLLYNSLVLLVLTPANRLFLLYVAMLSLSIWSISALIRQIDVGALRDRFSLGLPARGIAIYTAVIVLLNALIWLRGIVPTIFASGSPAFLNGTGVATNIVYVQDLAFWLPLMAAAAIWLYRRKPWGYLVIGSVLTMWVIESISIAVDQWFGHNADPASSIASVAFTPIFAVLAVVGIIPLYFYYRNLD
ncbi:MAG: hypothetical protein QOH92_2722 [Chloroflexota bacterium]|jgi:hypothetical protein|nr:hypothetical protein [Chloroflexota bacterium]